MPGEAEDDQPPTEATERATTGSDVPPAACVSFYPLFTRPDPASGGEEYIIGDESTGRFIAIPRVGFEAIELLQAGRTIDEVRAQLSAAYDDDVEVASFVSDLVGLGFVRAIDGVEIARETPVKKKHLTWIKGRHVRWLFSKPALACYFVCYWLALFIVIGDPGRYFPQYQHYFFHPRYTAIVLVSFALGWLLVFKHELFHLFAAKRVGVEGRFGISRRLHYIVAETDVTNLWTVDRRKRYIVYVAGMISDTLVISTLLIMVWCYDLGVWGPPTTPRPVGYSLAQMVIMLEFARVLWQFKFFLRTDVYYIIATFFNCKNLHADSKAWLTSKLARVLPPLRKKVDMANLATVPKREWKFVKGYGLLLIAGVAITLGTAFYYGLLPGLELTYGMFMNLFAGPAAGAAFVDAVIVLCIEAFSVSLLIVIVVRERRKKRNTCKKHNEHNEHNGPKKPNEPKKPSDPPAPGTET